MNLFYKIFILTFLLLYSALAIALLGSWVYRKVRSRMGAGAAARPLDPQRAVNNWEDTDVVPS